MTERSAPPRGPDGGPDSGPVDLLGQFLGADAHDHELRPRARAAFLDPDDRARALRAAYEKVLSGDMDAFVSDRIQSSWGRALAAGVDPDSQRPPRLHEIREIRRLRAEHPLAPFVPALAGLLGDDSVVGTHILVIASAAGEVLWRVGSPDVIRLAESLEFVEGARWSEDAVGTNAIGNAVVEGRANQVFSAEHLVRSHHNWVCSAAPVYDPETRALLGVLDVSGPYRNAHPDALALVRCGAALVHEMLRGARREADERARDLVRQQHRAVDGIALLSPGGRPVLGELPTLTPSLIDQAHRTGRLTLPDGSELPAQPQGEYLIVELPPARTRAARPTLELRFLGAGEARAVVNGREVGLSQRRAEILTLLATSPHGLTADELASEIYGDDGIRTTVRAEMHRIRAILDGCIRSNPYCFEPDLVLTADFLQVTRLVRAGKLGAALDAYGGPLLPRSSVLPIELLRDELHEGVRHAVLSAPGVAHLRRWVESEVGAMDPQAIRLLLSRLPAADSARAYLAARLRRIDREFGVPAMAGRRSVPPQPVGARATGVRTAPGR
ncbi:helix-turn-helix domain-containing protein [Nakamurella multipartita]|uniref:Transcriptional regulator domain protein n=1 Tax=Nakamurella multipartita (strain ATCC 700099 / DSM 44233 / CIP 104796 / JCM 9543 / NBRC 105858 / Y-104) TaxID=479431 RepID=C8XCD7_NAKMY|nr:GAF domain-containing protein [Nakamurella multipartita]ACV77502.1 transcriptional regulator domain protein [Nakamurella multipartita DSM 44233]